MDDAIIGILNSIGSGASDSVLDTLGKSPAAFNADMYTLATQIADVAVKPVTSVVLAIVFALELARVSTKVDGDRELGVKMVAAAMFKVGLVFLAAQNAMLFLKAINSVTEFLISKVQGVAAAADAGATTSLGDDMAPFIRDAGWGGQAGMLVLLILPFLASALADVVLTAVVFMIFVQLYMMMSFASLPIAFISSEETKSMGVGFFKRYAQTTVQLVLLWLGILFYRGLMHRSVVNTNIDGDMWGFIFANFGSFLLGSVLLILMIMTVSKVSKAVFGE